MARSTAAVLDQDVDRIIMAHGDIIETGGKAVLREATSWLPGLAATGQAAG